MAEFISEKQDLTYLEWSRPRRSSGTVGSFLKAASEDFKERGEEKAALDVYYDAEKTEGETPLEFCVRLGFGEYVYRMLVVDFLILNRDRHGANIELLRNPKKKTVRLAPLFDHGLSLLAPCRTREEIERFDVLYDRPVQSWLGTRSAYENLKLIPGSQLPRLKPLSQSDRNYILGDLHSVLDEALLNKIWDMIWGRWRIYEDFCNQK